MNKEVSKETIVTINGVNWLDLDKDTGEWLFLNEEKEIICRAKMKYTEIIECECPNIEIKDAVWITVDD